MTKSNITQYDNTAANNTDVEDVPLGENLMYPAHVNNAFREIMADLADINDGTVALTSPQLTSADIDGGTIDGTTIGGSTAAAGTFTTLTGSGDVAIDTDTLFVDVSADKVGIGTTSPAQDVHIKTTTTNNQIRVEASGGNLNVGNDSTGSFVESTGSRPFRNFVNGSERMRIDSSGNMDVYQGNKIRWRYAAGSTIRGSIEVDSADNIKFFNGSSETERMRIDTNGQVGIGTSSPTQNFDVSSDSAAASVVARTTSTAGNTNVAFRVQDGTTGTGTGSGLYLGRASAINYLWTYENEPWVFATNNTERMRIDTNGQVGIGEAAPVTPLTIATTNKLGSTFTGTTNGEGLTVTQTNYTAGNYISLVEAAYDDNNDVNPNVRIGAMFDNGGSNLAFGTSNSYASGITNTAMFIDSSGNVGIGTSSPSAPLHIVNSSTPRIEMGYGGSNGDHRIAWDGAGLVISADQSSNKANSYLAMAVDGSEHMRINSSGQLLVNKTSNSLYGVVESAADSSLSRAFVSQITASNGTQVCYWAEADITSGTGYIMYIRYNNSNVGGIFSTSSSTSFTTSSDHRLKENVETMTGAITRVKALKPKRFSWIIDDLDDANVDGFLAHEAAAVVPESVIGTHNEVDENGDPVYQSIDQAKLVPLLTAALQEAITKIEALETQNADFETRIAALEAN
jgi:hypothetical protein